MFILLLLICFTLDMVWNEMCTHDNARFIVMIASQVVVMVSAIWDNSRIIYILLKSQITGLEGILG